MTKKILFSLSHFVGYGRRAKSVIGPVCTLVIALTLFSGVTSAAIITWINSDLQDSRWENPSHWDLQRIPNADDHVQIVYDPQYTPDLNPSVVFDLVFTFTYTRVRTLDLVGGSTPDLGPSLTIGDTSMIIVENQMRMQGSSVYLRGVLDVADFELGLNSNIIVDHNSDTATLETSGHLYGKGSIVKSGTGTLRLAGTFVHEGGTFLNAGNTYIDSNGEISGKDGTDGDFANPGEDGGNGSVAVSMSAAQDSAKPTYFLVSQNAQVYGGWGGDGSDHDTANGGRGGDGAAAITVNYDGDILNRGIIQGGIGGDGGDGEVDGGRGGSGGHGIVFDSMGRYRGDGVLIGGQGGWGGWAETGIGGDGSHGGDGLRFDGVGNASQSVNLYNMGVVSGGSSGVGGEATNINIHPHWLNTHINPIKNGEPLEGAYIFSNYYVPLDPNAGISGNGGAGIRFVSGLTVSVNDSLVTGGWGLNGGKGGAAIIGGGDLDLTNIDGVILGGYGFFNSDGAPAIELYGSSNKISNTGWIYGGGSLFEGEAAPAIVIIGHNNIVSNAGEISGGMWIDLDGGEGLANAIEIVGNSNTLQIEQASKIIGNVVMNGSSNTLQFDHGLSTQDWVFEGALEDHIIAGRDDLYVGFDRFTKTGDGRLIMNKANAITGDWELLEGTLRTENIEALGQTVLGIKGNSTLEVVGELQLNSLVTGSNQNQIVMLGNANTNTQALIRLDNNLIKDASGDILQFVLNTNDYLPNTVYSLVEFGNTNLTMADIQGNSLYGLTPKFYFSDSGDILHVTYTGGAISGPRIQNSSPYFTPVTADFIVDQDARTGNDFEDNTINSLTFMPGTTLQIYNNLYLTSGQLNVSEGRASIQGGNLVIAGGFEKLGEGTLVMAGVLRAGQAHIREGGLIVNGSLFATGGTTVYAGAYLGGSGVIHGSVVNHGTVSPGNSPGTLTISGNYTQGTSGVLVMELASSTWHDRLVITGNARLGGTLRLVSLGGYLPEYGDKLGILHAGSVTGEFDGIEVAGPYRGRMLFGSDGEGQLLFAPDSYTRVAYTDNQYAVAAALDEFIPARNEDREVVSIALDHLRAEEYPLAFEQIHPGFYSGTTDILIEQASSTHRMLGGRLDHVRYRNRLEPQATIHDPLAAEQVASAVPQVPARDWNAWLEGTGIFAQVRQAGQVENHRHDTGGYFGGADYRMNENTTLGLFAGYQTTRAKYDRRGRNTVDGVVFGGYASWDNQKGLYVDAILGAGVGKQKSRRPIAFSSIQRSARADGDQYHWNAALTVGHDWQKDDFTFGLSLTGEYTRAAVQSFTEFGAESLNLRVSHQAANSFRTRLGGTVHYDLQVSEGVTLRPGVHAYWQHELANDARDIYSALNSGNGSSFRYRTRGPSRDSVQAGVGISGYFRDGWSAQAIYSANFGRGDYTAHQISLGINKRF